MISSQWSVALETNPDPAVRQDILGPAKGRGLGRAVMELAEVEAQRRGMVGMWVDTFTFQAPGFYLKLGVMECGRITGYPPGHDRIFFVKRFDAVAEESSDA